MRKMKRSPVQMPHFTQVLRKRHRGDLVSRHPHLTYLAGFEDINIYWFCRCHRRGFVSDEPRVFGSQPAMICGLRSPTGAPRLAAGIFRRLFSTAKVFTFSLCDISNNYQQWERGKSSLHCQLRNVGKISDRNSCCRQFVRACDLILLQKAFWSSRRS